MKPNDFEDILQQAANEFNPTVSDLLYKGLLKKQAAEKRKNKRLLLFSLVSLVALCTIIGAAFWVNKPIAPTLNILTENNTTTSVGNTQTTTTNQTNNTLTKRKSHPDKKQLTTNDASRTKKVDVETHQNSAQINALNNNKTKQQSITDTNNIADFESSTPIKQHDVANTNKPIAEPQITATNKILYAADSNLVAKQIATNNNTQNTIDNKIISSDSLIQPKPVLATITDTVLKPPTPQAKQNKWGLLLSGAFQPITTIKNTASHLPAKFYDSLGLSPSGQLGVGGNVSIAYQFTPQLSLLFGLGYQQVKFETISAVNVHIDSTEFLLANNKFYAASNTHFILDTKLSWLEVPMQMQYKFNPIKRLSSYVQGGFVLQKMITQKGISINQDAKGVATLTSIKNTELNRFSNLQMALLFETGFQYNVSKHINIQLGVAYKQQLNNHYKNNYTKEKPGYYIGILPSIKFIF